MERRRLCEGRLLKALTVKGKGVTQMGYLCTYRDTINITASHLNIVACRSFDLDGSVMYVIMSGDGGECELT